MKHALLICTLLALVAGPAAAQGIPDLSHAYWSCRATEPVTVIACPAGDGTPLSAALPADGGAPVDATIDVTVLDWNDTPIADFPFEDIWLEAPGLAPCPGGTVASASTDPLGRTTIRYLAAGGQATAGSVQVLLNGDAIDGSAPGLRIASPDITGDGVVNLNDLGTLANDYFGVYSPRSDLDGDGALDLTDVVFLVQHYQHTCP
jgi:hypothetical protein